MRDKEELPLFYFVERLRSYGTRIYHEEYYRSICNDGETDPRYDEFLCRLECDDTVAFLSEAHITADSMERDNQWFTFDNGVSYYDVSDVKEAIEHFDQDQYIYDDDLLVILSNII